MEQAIVGLFTEVRRHKPSVIYIPNIDVWYETLSGTVALVTFTTMLKSIPVPQKSSWMASIPIVMAFKIPGAQKQRPEVKSEGETLEIVFRFRYLGSIFAADGSQIFDVERRVALVMRRCGQLKQGFDSDVISLRVKLNIGHES